ncbi:MAG: DUF3466 family protein, partial [Gammaproteobacteria bacterium]|nr:DUF3466 family protein [Gammaproteobacteria bacterium]
GDQIRVLVKSHEPVTVEYELIDLGIVTPSVLLVINESGQVAGTGFFDGIARAFMYDGTTVINLDPESTMTSMAYSINDSGDVVGYTYPYVSSVDRYLSRATLFSNGTITNLGVQVAPLWNKLTSSRASAINNTGTIVGNSSVLLNGSIQYAAVNFGESITVLPGVTGLSYVTGINNNNVSVGQIGFSYKEAAIFTDTGIIKPFAQHPEIRGSTARSISDSGLVVGSILQPDLSTDLFIYDMHSRRNTYIDFGISPYSRLAIGESSRIDVNSQGQVIGFKIGQSGAFGPFVYYYETGQYVELATQFYDLGWTLSSVSGINDKGQIVGTGFFNGERRAVILNPIKNNSDPVLQPIGNLLINEGELFELTLHATDPDGDTLSFSMSNAPLGATLDAITGVFQWTPDFTQAGTYSDIEFIVTDSGNPIGIDAEIISITVGNTNRPPTITPIGQILVEENESIFFHVDAIDPDGDNVSIVAQLQNLSDGQRLAGVLPEGARFSIDNNFSWTPDFTQNGTYIIDFHATDSGTPNLTTTNSVVITVGNTSNPVSLSSFIVEQIIQTPLSQSLVNATIANMKKVGKFIEAGRVQAARNQVASFKNKIVLATEQGEIDAINAQKLTGLGDELLNLLN